MVLHHSVTDCRLEINHSFSNGLAALLTPQKDASQCPQLLAKPCSSHQGGSIPKRTVLIQLALNHFREEY
jgi:hypothetical protein